MPCLPPPVGPCAGAIRTVEVSTVAQLNAAISDSTAGDCINIAAGTYQYNSNVNLSRGGTAASRLIYNGAGPTTIIRGNASNAFQLNTGANYITFKNMRFTNFFYGPYINPPPSTDTGGQFLVFDTVEIDHMQQQGLAIQNGASNGSVRNCSVHDTGLALNGTSGPGQFGEGIYLGGTGSNCTGWIIEYTSVTNTTAENIEVNGLGTVISHCTLDGGSGRYIPNVQNALIGVNCSNVSICDNVLTNGMPHGIACYVSGTTKFFARRNTIHLNSVQTILPAYGIHASNASSDRTVGCDNVVDNIPGGGSSAYNVTCTP